AVYDGCPKLEYLGTSECWNILDTDLVDKINARSGWENVDVVQVYDYDVYNDSDEYGDDDDGQFYEYNYDTEDPDFY
ncbi:hypothetical protein GGI20_002936, partial [Coemansia sp. BCRC 34301]